MAYEYESKLYTNSVVHSITENVFIETGETKEIKEVYRKAKAFDAFLKYKKHVEKYNNSDCHELEKVFESVIKEYEEDK